MEKNHLKLEEKSYFNKFKQFIETVTFSKRAKRWKKKEYKKFKLSLTGTEKLD